jgi:transaldolase
MPDKKTYFEWLTTETPTTWWHDSANPDEIREGLAQGALGVTTNPVLTYKTLQAHPEIWEPLLADIPTDLRPEERAEAILRKVTTYVAKMLWPIYEKTNGWHGYALGQLDPSRAGDADAMLAMARRVGSWAPNIAIKLPTTQAGLEVIEEIAAEGLKICATINVSVAQAIEVGERYRKGITRAKAAGIVPGPCFAVQQVGRLDDYLRDVAKDMRSGIGEADIIHSGLAVAKRTYEIYRQRGYEAVIMPAGLRGPYHLAELAGAKMTLSIAPRAQKMILAADPPQVERIDAPIDAGVLKRLLRIPEFARAYEPDGLKPPMFITFGVVQKLLSQFTETGWAPLEIYGTKNTSARWT